LGGGIYHGKIIIYMRKLWWVKISRKTYYFFPHILGGDGGDIKYNFPHMIVGVEGEIRAKLI